MNVVSEQILNHSLANSHWNPFNSEKIYSEVIHRMESLLPDDREICERMVKQVFGDFIAGLQKLDTTKFSPSESRAWDIVNIPNVTYESILDLTLQQVRELAELKKAGELIHFCQVLPGEIHAELLAEGRPILSNNQLTLREKAALLREALAYSEAAGQLTELKLRRRNLDLRALPPEISFFRSLQKLDLTGNHLRELPPEIGNLTALRYLDLAGNHLRELPSEIGKLTALTWLNLQNTQLRDLPPEIGNLTVLTELNLSILD